MDLYQMKYENIADRLKRLATSPPPTAPQPTTHAHGLSFRAQTSNPTRKDNVASESVGRSKYQEALKYTKLTQETDHTQDQQPLPTTSRHFPRDYLSPANRERKDRYDRTTDYVSNSAKEREQEERMTVRKAEGEEGGLAKVKSESTLKMEEIMESFNSYKQNKEKFLSSIGKYSHNRTETEPVAKCIRVEQFTNAKQDTSRPFNEIDNIWNDDRTEEKVPQFQRSRKAKCQLDDLTDILNQTIEFQENADNRMKDFSRPKAVPRNISKTEESVVDKPAVRSILSPRGVRAPGKICKNNTRDVTSYLREGF